MMQRVLILAVVVGVKRYRFWRAFREAKHGRPDALRLIEREFLERATG